MDSFVLNVRQIAQYPQVVTPGPTDAFLLQQGGLGGVYQYTTPFGIVSSAMAQPQGNLTLGAGLNVDGAMNVGTLATFAAGINLTGALTMSVGPIAFDGIGAIAFNSTQIAIGFDSGQNMVLGSDGELTMTGQVTVGRAPAGNMEVANAQWVLENTVNSINGETGAVTFGLGDITANGGAPITNPHFIGIPTAPSPMDPTQADTQLATTEWVQVVVCNALKFANNMFVSKSGDLMGGALRIDASLCPSPLYNVADLVLYDTTNVGYNTNYNLVSLNKNYMQTMESKGGGNIFQGHSAFGNYSDVDKAVQSPGDPINMEVAKEQNIVLVTNEAWQGDLSTAGPTGLATYCGWTHLGTGQMQTAAFNTQGYINSNSTGPSSSVIAGYGRIQNFATNQSATTNVAIGFSGNFENWATAPTGFGTGVSAQSGNYAAGTVYAIYGLSVGVQNAGGGTVTNLVGCNTQGPYVGPSSPTTSAIGYWLQTSQISGPLTNFYGMNLEAPNPTTFLTNCYGLVVNDHSVVGANNHANIISQGAGSINAFNGTLLLGHATPPAALADGYLWYDGTHLNFRIGTTTHVLV